MKKTALFLLLYGLLHSVFAQSFKGLDTGGIVYYEYKSFLNENVVSVTVFPVDSQWNQNGATVYQLNKLVSYDIYPDSCAHKDKPGLLGKEIRFAADSALIAFNAENDSVVFYPFKQVGFSWICYHNTDSNIQIEAKITGLYDTTILDIADTLIKIQLSVKNNSGVVQTKHYLHNNEVLFSRHWGIVRMFNINDMPYTTTNRYKRILDLCGYLKKDGTYRKGVTNFYKEHIFDYDIGDEVHEKRENGGGGFPDPYTVRAYATQTIKKVIGKTVIADSIIYTFQVRSWYHESLTNPVTEQTTARDSIFEGITTQLVNHNPALFPYRSSDFNLPGTNSFINNNIIWNKSLGTMITDFNEWNVYSKVDRTDCWQLPFEPPLDFIPKSWIWGAGGPYFQDSYATGYVNFTPVYIKKKNGIYGTPLPQNVGLQNIERTKTCSVYPNPANTFITISNLQNANYMFSLFDIAGNLMMEQTVNTTKNNIDLTSLV